MMKRLVPDILLHLQNSAYGSLLTENATPDIPAIKRYFFFCNSSNHLPEVLVVYDEMHPHKMFENS